MKSSSINWHIAISLLHPVLRSLLGLAELLALSGIHINCVNILVMLFWCIYWLLDYLRVYLAVCYPAREKALNASKHRDPQGLLKLWGRLSFVALMLCQSKEET